MTGQVIAYNLTDLLREQPTVGTKPPARSKPEPKETLDKFKAKYGL
jgi:hypothetical protein